jgi:hypothetical protein
MPEPKPGMLLRLKESDYKFGSGPLLCKVGRVIEEVILDDASWWRITGECASGTLDHHGGWRERELCVVSSADGHGLSDPSHE